MESDKQKPNKQIWVLPVAIIIVLTIVAGIFYFYYYKQNSNTTNQKPALTAQVSSVEAVPLTIQKPTLDIVAYDTKILAIANNPPLASSTPSVSHQLWPVKTAYPLPGAILPFHRIVAYYGNLYSQYMGVLGQYPEDEMLSRLQAEVATWQKTDPSTPAIPALHYIAVVAQAGPGKDGKHRLRMPDSQIQKVLSMAEKINALIFLDVQLGQSDLQTEIPLLEPYLKLPNVHLGIDPEFAMHNGAIPGSVISSLDATDINFASHYLAKIVTENNLPPKILIIHRFTNPMVTNYQNITPLPEVQIVMNMDGFGGQSNKLSTYEQYISKQPVQFTGFKLFYKNDNADSHKILTPEQLLKLSPIPLYIQYQ